MSVNQDYEIRNTATDKLNLRYESYWMTDKEIEEYNGNVVDI